jgi:hypothetical protein
MLFSSVRAPSGHRLCRRGFNRRHISVAVYNAETRFLDVIELK